MSRETMHIRGTWTQQKILQGKRARQWVYLLTSLAIVVLTAFLAPAMMGTEAKSSEQFGAAGNLTTYGFNNAHSNFNSAETNITASTAHQLKQKWAHKTGNSVTDQPAIATVGNNTVVFWGSWDGYLHATNVSNNARLWTALLGQTTDANCDPPIAGISSSPTVVTINNRQEVLVGGGDARLYALDAATGAVIWKTQFPGSSPSVYIWSSPTVFNGSIYIGSSSFGDCPLTQGQLLQLDAATGQITHEFDAVPNGCTGGGIWSTPTIDEATGKLYVTTGTQSKCTGAHVYAPALIELDATDISHFLDAWVVPKNQWVYDSDFGVTPTLFQQTINGVVTPMVGAANKNGIYYAFNRASIGNGPLWQVQISKPGACPQCGDGSLASSAWDGQTLYVAGGITIINGQTCRGNVGAINPNNMVITAPTAAPNPKPKYLWQDCLHNGPVLGSVTVAGTTPSTEVVAVSQGNTVTVASAATGKTLASLSDHQHNSLLYAPPTIANGVLYVGNMDGNLYAYSINGA